MSNFFNYDAPGAAKAYDRTRIPVGANAIGAMLQIHCGKPLKDVHVLDAGCGTGHYAKVLADMGVRKLCLLDASSEMLNIAKHKLEDNIKHSVVDIIKAKLPDLPFDDRTFDVVMFNNVLHHIDKDWDGKSFPMLEKTLLNTKRILQPKGVLIITTILQSTITQAIWCNQIHPGITEVLSRCYPSAKQFFDLFAKCGFHTVSAMNFLNTETSSMHTGYWNPEGPLNEEWRNAVHVCGVAGPAKEKEMIDIVLTMKKNGTLEDFMVQNDHTSERGLYTLFVCIST